jgi:outer membrane protein assembly factor BamB
VESSPTVVGKRVYFGAGDDGVWCLETNDERADPKIVWKFRGLHVDSSPAVADGRLFAGGVVGDELTELAAVALDVETGRPLWRVDSPLPVPAAPAYHDGRVFFALGNGKLNVDADEPAGRVWCLDAASGKRQWEFVAGNSILGSPACAAGQVFFGSRDAHCYAVDERSGELRWKRDLDQPIVASPAVAGGKVYVLNTAGVLFCLSASDGTELWRFDEMETENLDAYASPTLAGGRLYVACGGKVYCIGERP